MSPKPKPRQSGAEDSINTMQVLLTSEGQGHMVLPPTRRLVKDDDSADGRTVPLYRLHGVEHGDDLATRLQERRSAFTDNAPRFLAGHVIGEGSQGLIMRVHDRDCRRDVALKTLHHAGCDLDEISRFIHEAQVTAQLEHPGIVPVHDVGVLADGTVFYTMKRVEGSNLADYLMDRAGKPELRFELLELYLRACEAIAFAHSRGVIHRDLKPRNIMVGPFGEVLVLDWGLAKIVGMPPSAKDRIRSRDLPDSDGDVHRTMEGFAVGTPAYMSPEQARGVNQLIIDQRCDVYSLGVILYEMLCGVSPYQRGNVRKTLEQAARGEWKLLHLQEAASGVPRRLVAIVHKAMAFEVSQRYQSVSELIDDLHNFLSGRPVGAYRETLVESALRHLNNHRKLVVSVAITIVLAVVLIGVWRWHEYTADAAQIAGWFVDAGAKRKRGDELYALAAAQADPARSAAQRHEAQTIFAESRRAYEGILQLRQNDLLATEGLREIGKQLERIAEDENRIQRRKDDEAKAQEHAALAETCSREAQNLLTQRNHDACVEKLAKAAEHYQQALGFMPNDQTLQERYRGVLRRRAEREADNDRIIADQAKREQAEQQIQDAQKAKARNDLENAIVLLKGAINLRSRPEDVTLLTEWTGSLTQQRAAEIRNRNQEEAKMLFQAAQADLAKGDIDQAVANMSKAQDLDPNQERFRRGNQQVDAARRLQGEKDADRLLTKAEEIQRVVDQEQKILAEVLDQIAQVRPRAMEDGDAEAIAQLSDLERRADLLRENVAKQLALVITQLLQAEARASDYPQVRDRLAVYYVQRLEEAERENRTVDAEVAKAMAERYVGPDSRFAAIIQGRSTVVCARDSLPLSLRSIRQVEGNDRAEAVQVTLAPGQTASIPHGRYQVEGVAANGAVIAQARIFPRGQTIDLVLRPSPPLPPDMVYIPAGRIHSAGGKAGALVPAFALGRHEVTCGEWIAFLNDPAILQRHKEERARGIPRFAPRTNALESLELWQQQAVPVWQKYPGEFRLIYRDGNERVDPGQPVTNISFADVEDYLVWRRNRDRIAWRLPTAAEWSLAAQGGDGRAYPWGGQFDPHGCASGYDLQRWPRDLLVGIVKKDRSVQGICDLAGSVSEFCSDTKGDGLRTWMGGNFTDRLPDRFRSTSSRACDALMVYSACGFRLALTVP